MDMFLKVLYNILLWLLQPIILLRLLFRSRKIYTYRYRLSERYGFCKNKVLPEGILLHAVSVGETLSAIPLIRALRHYYPLLPITITTMTPTGSECVVSAFNKDIHHVYLPYDLPFFINHFLNVVRPKLVIIMETELWPNMISALYQRKIPLIIANARLSERSVKSYAKLGKFMHHLLSKITLIAAQNKENAARFIKLGLKTNQLAITGNLKFDISITPESTVQSAILRKELKLSASCYRQVWIASSTHNGEEVIILKAHRRLLKTFPKLLLILVPRHPERFEKVRKIVQKIGFNFILRSIRQTLSDNIQVIIGDTMGELMLLYSIADIAFIGGSLVKKGGHNPLEAAIYSVPILMGPYTFNFKEICDKLQEAGGLIRVNNVNSLVKEISNLIFNKNCRLLYGQHAFGVLYKNKGALSRTIKLIKVYLPFSE